MAKQAEASSGRRGGGDRAFLEQALGANELELRLGRLAAERSGTPELKEKARKMVENHTKLGAQLSDLAREDGLSPHPALSPEQQEKLRYVESQPAGSFDAAFKQTVDAGHVRELAMYREEVGRAVDPRLRAFAEQRVVALQQAVVGAEQAGNGMR